MANPFDDPLYGLDPENPFSDSDYGKDPGLIRSTADTGIAAGRGVLTGIRGLTDAAGAGNRASRALDRGIQGLTNLESSYRQNERAGRQHRIEQANKSGSVGQELKAYLGAFAEAPIDTTVEALGTSVPSIAGAIATRGRSAAVPAGIAATQGAGFTKSSIYDAVRDAYIEHGVPQAEAERRARIAQSYGGDNIDQILLGTGLGALAGSTGIESTISRMLGRQAGSRAAEGVVRGAVQGALREGPMEALQGGHEQFAGNIAQRRAGFDQPLMEGVIGSAALEGVAGSAAGGGFGAVEGFGNRGRTAPDDTDADEPLRQQRPQTPPSAGGGAGPQFMADNPGALASGPILAPEPVPEQYRRGPLRETPSESMGINPADGPLSTAAALAVDGGLTQNMQDMQDMQDMESAPVRDTPEARRSGLLDELAAVRSQASARGRTQEGEAARRDIEQQLNEIDAQIWDSLDKDRRAEIVARTDLRGVIAKNVARSTLPWESLNPETRRKLSAAMSQQSQEPSRPETPEERVRADMPIIERGDDADIEQLLTWPDDHIPEATPMERYASEVAADALHAGVPLDEIEAAFFRHENSPAALVGNLTGLIANEREKTASTETGDTAPESTASPSDEIPGWDDDGLAATAEDPTAVSKSSETEIDALPNFATPAEITPVTAITDDTQQKAPESAPAEAESTEIAPQTQGSLPVVTDKQGANINEITRKQIPEMTDDELVQAIEHYGPDHKRTAKLKKEQSKRGSPAPTSVPEAEAEAAEQPYKPGDVYVSDSGTYVEIIGIRKARGNFERDNIQAIVIAKRDGKVDADRSHRPGDFWDYDVGGEPYRQPNWRKTKKPDLRTADEFRAADAAKVEAAALAAAPKQKPKPKSTAPAPAAEPFITTTKVSPGITATVIDPSALRAPKPKAKPAPAPEPVVNDSFTTEVPVDGTDTDVGTKTPAPAKAQFADNKIFTADKVAAAKARMKAKLSGSQLNTGIDPELLIDGMIVAGAYIESGVRNFAQYSKAMIEDMGDGIRPFLLSFWEGARNYPGLDSTGMTDPIESARQYREIFERAPSQTQGETNEQHSRSDESSPQEPEGRGAEPVSQPTAEPAGAGPDTDGVGGNLPAEPGSGDGQGTERPNRKASADRTRGGNADDGSGEAGVSGPVRPRAKSRQSNPVDYQIAPDHITRTLGWKKVAEQNVEIIETVKRIKAEKRLATKDEQDLLTRFTSWGASEIANGIFADTNGRYKDDGWKALGERLKAALTPEEYAAARRVTQYAHYTSEATIRSIYSALEGFGFAGGSVVEPGMGIGLFKGMMPPAMAAKSEYTGIEYDPMTGAIAELLYPASNIITGDFTETRLPKDYFDAAIGNPPFSSVTVTNDAEYRKQNFLLHDYFFAKTIDRVRPGGLLVFVTSAGTMNKPRDRARKYLSDRADLLGAIRLPQTAFKHNAGTEVVTDIVFLRKRKEGEAPAGEAWLQSNPLKIGDETVNINEYFIAHPEMVLGRHSTAGSMYRANEYTVEPRAGKIEDHLAEAVEKLPKDVYRPERGTRAEKAQVMAKDFDPKSKKEGGLYVAKDGTLMQVEDGVGVALTQRLNSKGELSDLTPKERAWLSDWTGLRDALKQAQYDQLNDGDWESSLNALNKAYDAFTKKHGALLAHTVSERERRDEDGNELDPVVMTRFKNKALIAIDAEGALAFAMEDIPEPGKTVKSALFKGRVLNKPTQARITNARDAMWVYLNEAGKLDMDAVAKLAGMTRDETIAELGDAIFEDPTDGWVTSDEYLSGQVIRKLREAETVARTKPQYKRNVAALEAVQPKPLTSGEIVVTLGAAWIPAKDVQRFVTEVLESKAVKVRYMPESSAWHVEGQVRESPWGIPERTMPALFESVLNNRQIKITWKDQDGTTHVNAEATEKANDIAKKMRAAFRSWLWTDTERTNRLLTEYNERYNNIAPRAFDGEHLTLPGVSSRFVMRPHQKRAIWRTIQQGDVYYAHAVGAGKTFTMIASGMEERRLGLVKKPMYVVPNHMLAQFSKEFMELYPAARIMVADEQNFHTINRRRFVAQAALNDPDAIVITHSAFMKIPVSTERMNAFLQARIDEWESLLEQADKSDRAAMSRIKEQIESLSGSIVVTGEDGKKKTVKQQERAKENVEKKAKASMDVARDNMLDFEQLGVDRLYIDEGHEFRKLDFATERGSIKGIDPKGSKKAMDLMMKVEYLREKNPRRALVMASGTPVTNTMGELYTVQRYFQPDLLAEDGEQSFDMWANHYGEVVEGLEQNAAGGYEVTARFAKFINVPELMTRVRSFMDVLTSKSLGDLVERPDVEGGGREIVVTPVPDGYKEYQKKLEERIKAIRARKGRAKKGDDIILNVINDGRFSAIDMRFVDPKLPSDPKSKLNITIDEMIKAYHESADLEYTTDDKPDALRGASMMLFSDLGLGDQAAASRGFDMKRWITSRLIEGGVKPDHIAFMRDNKSHAKKGKLFEDLRQGKKRILIGGKDMETGVNAQKRLKYEFHLDAPWFPASVEQREGRIIRQKNQNAVVVIKAFATKGSYDSTMWGMIARKARFIEQAMNGDMSVRHMEDVSESSQFEMASALASGDVRYLKLAGLRGDVERLSRLESAHYQEQSRLQSKLKSAERDIEQANKRIPIIDADIAKIETVKAGAFTAIADGQEITKREEWGQAMYEAFKPLVAAHTEEKGRVVGKIAGFDVVFDGELEPLMKDRPYQAELSLTAGGENTILLMYPYTEELNLAGMATRAINAVERLHERRDLADLTIAKAQQDIAAYTKRIGLRFPEESELREKYDELQALEAELTPKTATGLDAPPDAVDSDDTPRIAEDKPEYGPYTTDLFGNALPEAPRARGRRQRNLQPAPRVPGDTDAPAGDYHTRTIVGVVQQRELATNRIKSLADLAQATQYLYRSAVERLDAVVTDAKGKPLAVVGGFKGTIDGASVYPFTIIGEAVRVPGAAQIWFSHNHPSGISTLSGADETFYASLDRAFRGSGIEPMGLIAIGQSFWSGTGYESGRVAPPGKSTAVPVIERELVPSTQNMPSITNADSATRIGAEYYKQSNSPGIIFLTSQHKVAAWMPIPDAMRGALRNTGQLRAIYRAISESNAAAAVIVHRGELDAVSESNLDGRAAYQNIAGALQLAEVRALDVVDLNKQNTLAETGERIGADVVYSRTVLETQGEAITADTLADAVTARIPKLGAAIPQMLEKGRAGRRGGVVVINSADPAQIAGIYAKKTGRQYDNSLQMFSDQGRIQGFYDGRSGLTFLIGPNLSESNVAGVLLHEIYHSDQRASLDAQAAAMIEGRNKVRNTQLRDLLGRVAARMADSGETGNQGEAAAYIIEQAVTEGRSQGYSAADSRFIGWVETTFGKKVADLIAGFSKMVRQWLLRNGLPVRLTVGDLVDFAMGSVNQSVNRDAASPVASRGREDGRWYRSALADAIPLLNKSADKQGNIAPTMAKARLQSLQKDGKFKQDELQWSGLLEWLDMQTGKVPVEEIQNFFENNRVVVKDDTSISQGENTFDREGVENLARDLFDEQFPQDYGNWLYSSVKEAINDGWDNPEAPVWNALGKTKQDYLDEATDLDGEVNEDDAESSYVDDAMALDSADLFTDSQWDELRAEAWEISRSELLADAEREIEERRDDPVETQYQKYVVPGGKDYTELLIYLPQKRNGEEFRVAYKEEEGARNGGWAVIAPDGTIIDKFYSESTARDTAVLLNRRSDKNYRSSHWQTKNVVAHVRFDERQSADGKRVLFIEEIQSDWAQDARKGKQVPPAPFISKTEAWVSLAIKRVIAYAAENDFDRVAFINGRQASALYDLRKHVDRITIHPKKGGEWDIKGYSNNVQKVFKTVNSNAELEDTVGKDLATKAIENNGGEFTGDDLAIGGNGMVAFYDQIVPNVARSVLKKLGGGELTKAEVGTDTPQLGFDITDAMRASADTGIPLFSRAGAQTETAAFKRWFGDSKVVDENGKPLVVYHGTQYSFSAFDPDMQGDTLSTGDIGYFFTNDTNEANAYAMHDWERDNPLPNVMPVYLSMQNPLLVDISNPYHPGEAPGVWYDEYGHNMARYAQSSGYDGLIISDFGGGANKPTTTMSGEQTMYVAFLPEQIKSATGNTGAFDPENPDIRFSRASDIANEAVQKVTDLGQAIRNANVQDVKAYAQDVKAYAKGKRIDWMGVGLQLLGRRQLVDIYGGKFLPLEQYDRLSDRMQSLQNEVAARADDTVKEWRKIKDQKPLADLMHDATLEGIDADPTTDFDTVEWTEEGRKALYERFNALSPEAQAMYRKVRDMYRDHHQKVLKAMKDRVLRAELSSERKAELLRRMDAEFYRSVPGVYFPLQRFGQYVVAVHDAEGAIASVQRAETMPEANALRRSLLNDFPTEKGFTVGKVSLDKDFAPGRDAVGRGFIGSLFDAVDEMTLGTRQKAELEDTIGQLYLSSFPDNSWAKHGIHRKGTPGFSDDARRAFAQNMFQGGRYLSKLMYADQMQAELERVQTHADERKNEADFDQPKAQRVIDEMVKRHENFMSPKTNPVSSWMTSVGFAYFLGFSPATALVNLSQTPLVAYPIMGAKWGWDKAGKELLRASREAMANKNDISAALNEEEKAAFDQAVDDGTIDMTQSMDLAQIAQGEDDRVSAALRPIMRKAAWMFHQAEVFNRQVTFVAAYRLAREKSSAQVAFEQARKATYDGHFDYGAANRPRIAQGNWAKVIFLFKQYGQNMVYTLTRNAYLSLKGEDADTRKEAQRALGGILFMHFLAAGALGLPMVDALVWSTTVLAGLLGDDDEPWDAEVALRNGAADWLSAALGSEAAGRRAAEVLFRGVSRLGPADISGRTTLDDLVLPDLREGLDGARLGEKMIASMAGPVASMLIVNPLVALQHLNNGELRQAWEALLPNAAANAMKAYRYQQEGAVDRSRVPIKEEVSWSGIGAQAFGFSPSEVRRAFEGRQAIMGEDRALSSRRSELLRQFALASMDKDTDGIAKARKEIREWNKKNPNRVIKATNMIQSVRARQRRIDQSEQGVYLSRNRREALEAGRFADY